MELLEREAADLIAKSLTGTPGEVLYALSLLEMARDYALHPGVRDLLKHESGEVRQRALRLLSNAADVAVLHDVLRKMLTRRELLAGCRLTRAKFRKGRSLAATFDAYIRDPDTGTKRVRPLAAIWSSPDEGRATDYGAATISPIAAQSAGVRRSGCPGARRP